MKVTVIGTACTWFNRKNTSFLIDDNIVFDAPNGAYKDIMHLTSLENISDIIISHFHSDHFADLHIFLTRMMRELKNVKEKIRVFAPKGCLEKIIKMNEFMQGAADECDPEEMSKNVEFIDLYDGFEFKLGDYLAVAYQMSHGDIETYGFVIKQPNGKKVGFSADTKVCDNLHKILRQSDYAFVEMASTKPCKSHICIDEFEKLLTTYKDCKIYPVHTCDKCQKYAEEKGFNALNDGDILNF